MNRLIPPIVGRYYSVRRPGKFPRVKARLVRRFTERLLPRYCFFNTVTRQHFLLRTLKTVERGEDLQYKELL